MMAPNPLLAKLNWDVAARLPGPQSWDKMKVVNKGLSPLHQESMPSNTFLRNAWLHAFAKAGLPVPETKSASWGALKSLGKSLRGAGNRSAQRLTARLGQGVDNGWSTLFRESANGGTYNGMTHQIGPAFGRAFGGAAIGHQFDSSDENATPWGSLLGGVAGLSSPMALRKILGNPRADKGSLRRLFADRTISRRMVNDPLNRVMLSSATGNLVDLGAGAIGYDTQGWGERIGIMGGLAGGSRPLAQALAGRYQPVATALQSVGNTGIGQAFQQAQRGGYTHLPAYLLGSPYATGTGATMGMMTHGVLDATVGERVRNLAEKKKMLSSAMNTPEMEPAKKMMEQTLQQIYGPQARFYDADGTPSKEAIHLIQQLGRYGMMHLQQAGHRFFGDSEYMLDPQNWQRLSSPLSAFGAMMRGQATNLASF